jgi:adenylate cyclase, class 2
MKTELEAKFADIDIEEIRGALKSVGAVCEQPMRLMRRALIEEPHHAKEYAFIRIRDEGDKVTLAFKRRKDPYDPGIDGVKEVEVEVSDFDDTLTIFSEAGWHYITFQESKRETWKLGDVEVVIDEWPWLEPYIEVEGETEGAIRMVAEKLGLAWKDAQFVNVDVLYNKKYEFASGFRGVIDVPEARFGAPLPPQFIPRRTR